MGGWWNRTEVVGRLVGKGGSALVSRLVGKGGSALVGVVEAGLIKMVGVCCWIRFAKAIANSGRVARSVVRMVFVSVGVPVGV
jgi:hypothetical protein